MSSSSPDIFGYCGDVVFPSIVLSQHVSALDGQLQSGSFKNRLAALEQLVRISFAELPDTARNPFEIVHCGRDGEGLQSEFRVAVLYWSGVGDVERQLLSVADRSAAVRLSGSGAATLEQRLTAWGMTPAKGTTRSLFRGFVDALDRKLDRGSGGAPQLVGLYRINAGMSFGVLYRNKRFLHGMPVHALAPDSQLLWHNEMFERVNGVTRNRLRGAQRHGDLVVPPN